MQSLRRRVNALEQVCPKHDGPCTVEELYRFLWRCNKTKYLQGAEEGHWSLGYLAAQFEREDAERARAAHESR